VVQSIKVVTEAACRRFFGFALEWARAAGRKSVACVHKANILKYSNGLFLDVGREVAEEFIGGETLHGLSKRHDISCQLIRLWVEKFEAGAFDDDVQPADLIRESEAKIAALERMVGRQALEIELLKGALKHAPRPRDANTSVVTGPVASRSSGAAN